MNPIKEYSPMPVPKYCYLPTCENTSTKNLNKIFIAVPNSQKHEWCTAVGIECPKRPIHICEDHLNLEKDVENHQYWRMMKGRARLKPRLPQSLVHMSSRDIDQDINEPSYSEKDMPITYSENIVDETGICDDKMDDAEDDTNTLVESNLREDLINYYQCKIMNEEPKLKRSALLRNIGQDTNEGLSELNKLLLKPPSTSQPKSKSRQRKSKSSTSPSKSKLFKRIEDIAVPGTSTCSTLPINDEEAGICDNYMDDVEDNTNTLVESNVCRVCLAMDVKMYDLKDTELRRMFQNVTGICVPENNHSILERLCWECVGRLKTAAAFRNKALLSDTLLQGLASTGEQIRKNDITTIKENKEYLRPAGTLSIVEVFHPVDIDPENDSLPHILENNDTNIVEHTVGKDSHEIKKENIIDEDSDQTVIKDEPMIEFPIKTETEYDQFDYLCPNTGEDSRNVFTETNSLVGNDISLSENKINLPDSNPVPGCSHADPKYPVVGSLQNTPNNCKDKLKRNAIVINKKDLNAKIIFKKPKVLITDKSKNINVNIGGVSKKILIINKVTKTQVNSHTGEE